VLSKAFDAFYAMSAWSGDTFPPGLTPSVDTFVGWQQDRKFIVAAKRLSPGTTLGSWQGSNVARMEWFCGRRSQAFRNSTLGGVPAREWVNVCPSYDVIVLVGVHRGRGYIFQFVSPTLNTAASDRRIYDSGQRSFRFT
jgi:hypothetical protein